MSLSQQDPLPSTVPLLPACPGCVYPQRGRHLCDTSLTEDRRLPNLLIGFSFPFEQELRIRWPRRAFTTKTIPRSAPLGGSPASPRGQPRPGCALREQPRHPCAASRGSGGRGRAGGSSGIAGGHGGHAATKVKCAVCPRATRCPCGKGLGAARGHQRHGREFGEQGMEPGAPLPLYPALALPQPHQPRAASLDAGKLRGAPERAAGNGAAPGCS